MNPLELLIVGWANQMLLLGPRRIPLGYDINIWQAAISVVVYGEQNS